MAPLKVLVVDDEPLVREGLRDFLEREADVELVAECASGLEALGFLAAHPVDVVFLDIQMPELDGLGVASALAEVGSPTVVFVTAFSEHAVKAFELNAVDYLLKPFDQARFEAALERVRHRHHSAEQAELSERLSQVLSALRQRQRFADRMVVRTAGRIHFVAVDDIDWIEAADNYVKLHQGAQQHVMRETMIRLEERLDPSRFARIHRSTIVNLARVKHLEATFNGEYAVQLHSGATLTLSRTYRDTVRARLGGDW